MADEAAVPDGLREIIGKLVDEKIATYASSGPLRNASISGLPGLTVKAGSKITVQHPDGTPMIIAGAFDLNNAYDLVDGSDQPMFIVRRADGTIALAMFDPTPTVGAFQQFLAIFDRSGNVIVSDDTDSGQGLARPYLNGGFSAVRFTDFRYTVTSPAFETVTDARLKKQNPRFDVAVRVSMTTSGDTGELRVLANGVQLGATTTEGFGIATRVFGPIAVSGTHMNPTIIEIQGRVTSASGTMKIEPLEWEGRQS